MKKHQVLETDVSKLAFQNYVNTDPIDIYREIVNGDYKYTVVFCDSEMVKRGSLRDVESFLESLSILE